MIWDEKTVNALRDLWALGISTSEIGRRLGVSKNAAVGKANRLDLPGRPSPITHNPDSYYARRLARPPAAGAMTLPPLASVAAEIPIAIPRSAIAAPRLSRAIRTPIIVGPVVVPIERVKAAEVVRIWNGSSKCTMPLWGHHEQPTHRHCDKTAPLGDSWCAECRKVVFTRIRDQAAA